MLKDKKNYPYRQNYIHYIPGGPIHVNFKEWLKKQN